MLENKRVALVHDWLNGMRGGERVLEHFCMLFPHADIHTLLFEPARVSQLIRGMTVVESPFGRLPSARMGYRHLLPLMPLYARRLPTSDYDLVISTSHCVAKAAPPPRRGVHLSYVFSPMRYAWDHFDDYLVGPWWRDLALTAMRPGLQWWDRNSNNGVDSFAADSHHIAGKLKRFWGREAVVIHPPVRLDRFTPNGLPPEDFFLVVSALVPYKKIERAVRAAKLAKQRVVIVGGGPEEGRLKAMAGKYVEFVGQVPDEELVGWYQRCRALLYPGVEDFGITALEAQACGRPVIAFAGGGALETVREGTTGAFFPEPTSKSLARALKAHDDAAYQSSAIRAWAETFSPANFDGALRDWIRAETRFAW